MLTISGRPNEFRLLDAAGSATLGAALRANSASALQVLNLAYVDFWHERNNGALRCARLVYCAQMRD
jgi:hypothetical protein